MLQLQKEPPHRCCGSVAPATEVAAVTVAASSCSPHYIHAQPHERSALELSLQLTKLPQLQGEGLQTLCEISAAFTRDKQSLYAFSIAPGPSKGTGRSDRKPWNRKIISKTADNFLERISGVVAGGRYDYDGCKPSGRHARGRLAIGEYTHPGKSYSARATR